MWIADHMTASRNVGTCVSRTWEQVRNYPFQLCFPAQRESGCCVRHGKSNAAGSWAAVGRDTGVKRHHFDIA